MDVPAKGRQKPKTQNVIPGRENGRLKAPEVKKDREDLGRVQEKAAV